MSAARIGGLAAVLIAAMAVFAGPATASPGAYKILLAEAFPQEAKKLGGQLEAFPEVAQVDYANTSASTPSAAQLAPYDLVVSIGDNTYLDLDAWGDSLADFVDQGGVVVQTTYDNWEGGGAPGGRFASGEYPPFIPGDNVNDVVSLGDFDASSPLMQGVASLTSNELNTAPELAPGASLIAKWDTGANAIAVKGRVVSVTAFLGDHYGLEAWTGDYARLILNAAITLGRQQLTVLNGDPGGGTLKGPGGISCGSVCGAAFIPGTAVAVRAKPKKGYAFGGFGGDCSGTACNLTMDGPKTVEGEFIRFKFGKVSGRNLKKGRAFLQVKVTGRGKVVVFGKKVKKTAKKAGQAKTLTFPIIAKGKAAKTLNQKGKVKVGVNLAYIPTGGSKAKLSRKLVLRKN